MEKGLLNAVVALALIASANAATYYVTETGSGSKDGSDWNNAYAGLPAEMERGSMYYVASGNYQGFTFNTPLEGKKTVAVTKATPTEHGTDAGWQEGYGAGSAVFHGGANVEQGHFVLDGAVGGGPGSWKAGHGFEFTSPGGTSTSYVRIADGVSNVIARHIYFYQVGDTESSIRGASGITNTGTIYDSLFEYNYFDNLGSLPWFFRGGSNVTIQYSYSGDICGVSVADPNWHCEALVLWSLSDVHFRWNYVSECPSSGGFVKNANPVSSDVRIYGNFFENGFPINCNTGTCLRWRVFSNTFHRFSSGPFGGDGKREDMLFYNNLHFDGYMSYPPDTHDYNWYSQIDTMSCSGGGREPKNDNIIRRFPNACNYVAETLDPFADSMGNLPEDFRLVSAIDGWPAYDVCQLDPCGGENRYNIDLFGSVRGSDGVWDRGALELVSGACQPSCSGRECGPDGCGGICGECGEGYDCQSGQCEACIPNWECSEWGPCTGGEQARTCTDTACGGSRTETCSCSGADTDCDGCIDTDELLAYVGVWRTKDISMTKLMEAIRLWKNGC